MASLRRNRTMPTDGAIAKFLYTILKQLDLKTIDWNEVAGSLDITNGHAARMRFSRFKQQMEGIPTQTRKPKESAPKTKKAKQKQDKLTKPDQPIDNEAPSSVKREQEDCIEPMQGVEEKAPTSPPIKPEPKEEPMENFFAPETNVEAGWVRRMSLEPKVEPESAGFGFYEGDPPMYEMNGIVKEEPSVKLEPEIKVEPRWDE